MKHAGILADTVEHGLGQVDEVLTTVHPVRVLPLRVLIGVSSLLGRRRLLLLQFATTATTTGSSTGSATGSASGSASGIATTRGCLYHVVLAYHTLNCEQQRQAELVFVELGLQLDADEILVFL